MSLGFGLGAGFGWVWADEIIVWLDLRLASNLSSSFELQPINRSLINSISGRGKILISFYTGRPVQMMRLMLCQFWVANNIMSNMYEQNAFVLSHP